MVAMVSGKADLPQAKGSGAQNGPSLQNAERVSYNFFLILFKYLRNDMSANGKQELGALNHMNTEEKNQQNTVKALQQSEKSMQKNIAKAEAKKKKFGLLAKILGPIVTVFVATLTLGLGIAITPAATAAESGVCASLEGGMEAAEGAAEAVDESTAATGKVSASLSKMEEGVASARKAAKAVLKIAEENPESEGLKQAADDAESYASRAEKLVAKVKAFLKGSEEGGVEKEAASSLKDEIEEEKNSFKEALAKRKEEFESPSKKSILKSRSKYLIPTLTTVGVTAAGAIPTTLSSIDQEFAAENQEISEKQQNVMAEESNITDQINVALQRDTQTGMTATKQASETDASLANQLSNQMQSMYKLGSI